MARLSFLLGLATCFIALLSPAVAATIEEIFTVHPGTNQGGCNNRLALLNAWRQEIEFSIEEALIAIDNYETEDRVQAAMSVFFGVKVGSTTKSASVVAVRQEIQYVKDFFTRATKDGEIIYPQSSYWLFCDSTFLVEQDSGDIAVTFEGQNIIDDDGDLIPISSVPEYAKRLSTAGIKPWWAGDRTSLNGYYFSDSGADFCTGDNLGLTAYITPLTRGPDGEAKPGVDIGSVILCPYAIDTSPKPVSYRDASNLLGAGTNLALAIPRSATFLHEIFHLLRGGHFLQEKSKPKEEVDLGKCINFKATDQRRNPENFVFFIAHMNHLYGEPDGNNPWSIPSNWDFEFQGTNPRIFGAVRP